MDKKYFCDNIYNAAGKINMNEVRALCQTVLNVFHVDENKINDLGIDIYFKKENGKTVLSNYGIYRIAKAGMKFYSEEIRRLSDEDGDYRYVTTIIDDVDYDASNLAYSNWNQQYGELSKEFESLLKDYRESHIDMFNETYVLPSNIPVGNFNFVRCSSLDEAVSGYKALKALSQLPLDLEEYKTVRRLTVKKEYAEEYEQVRQQVRDVLGLPKAPTKIHNGCFIEQAFQVDAASEDYKAHDIDMDAINDTVQCFMLSLVNIA